MVTFQFYKVTGGKLIARLEEIRTAKQTNGAHLQKVCQDVGATEVFIYDTGGVSHFSFDKLPYPITSWKKVKHGYLPRKGDTEGRKIYDRCCEIKPAPDYPAAMDVFKDKGLDRMVFGEGTRQGVPMHKAKLVGKFDDGVFFIKVPVTDDDPYTPIDSEMVPCKEWETAKFMEEGE